MFDLKSTNGTHRRLTAPCPLSNGDEFRVGNKRFRFETAALAEPLQIDSVSPGTLPAGVDGIRATIEDARHPVSFAVAPSQTILEGLMAHLKQQYPGDKPEKHRRQPLNWECKGGSCGLCAVEILDGAGHCDVVAADAEELDTLEQRAFVDPDPKRFRLTCKVKLSGTVRLRIPA